MNNDWLKEKVKAELEIEYKQKLDELVEVFTKRMEENNQEAWEMLQNEKNKNNEVEVRLYREFEQKFLEYKRYVRNLALGVIDGMLSYDTEREFARKAIDEALGYMGENV
jgi:hypothetical protein